MKFFPLLSLMLLLSIAPVLGMEDEKKEKKPSREEIAQAVTEALLEACKNPETRVPVIEAFLKVADVDLEFNSTRFSKKKKSTRSRTSIARRGLHIKRPA